MRASLPERAGPRIVVATTFREFDGGPNDAIQRLFLDGLKSQTFRDWALAATVFRERKVGEVLRALDVPHVLVHADVVEGQRFSLTDVVTNGLEVASERPASILIWTTCDVLLPPDFLEAVMAAFQPMTCMTSSPHLVYSSLGAFRAGARPRYFFEGLDTLILDPDLLAAADAAKALADYRSVDWGMFEFFLAALARLNASAMVNLWPEVKIAKIENDRAVGREAAHYLSSSLRRNRSTFMAFSRDHGLTVRFPVGFTELARFKVRRRRVRHLLWHALSTAGFAWSVLRERARR